MNKEEFMKELKFILIRTLFLNIGFYLIMYMIFEFSDSIKALVGLILGTISMVLNIVILNYNVRMVINKGVNGKDGTPFMVIGYFFRIIITALFLYISLKLSNIYFIGAIIPLFYPKIIYFGKNLLYKKGGD